MLIAYILLFLLRNTLRENRFVRFIKEYTNALTHDLRSPLNSVHMASGSLLDGTIQLKPEDRTEYLRICKEQSKHMLDTIDRILTVAKAEQTHLVITPTVTPILSFLEAQKKAYLNDMLHEKPVSISIACTPEDLMVAWDLSLMENVVNNLFENAVKYSFEDVCIRVQADVFDGKVRLRFIDNGMGISAHDLDAIFRDFHRGSLLERKGKFGYGIGLSFLKKVVEAHDGQVMVESQLNVGSTFILLFPTVNTN